MGNCVHNLVPVIIPLMIRIGSRLGKSDEKYAMTQNDIIPYNEWSFKFTLHTVRTERVMYIGPTKSMGNVFLVPTFYGGDGEILQEKLRVCLPN